MKKLFLAILLAFVGCADKSAYNHDTQKNEIMAYTKKYEYIQGSHRYLAIASYINPVLKLDENDTDEYILLSFYPEDDDIVAGSVRLNGSDENLSIKELRDGSQMAKFTEFSMPWGKHYQITSSQIKNDFIKIRYQTQSGIKPAIDIRKISKSMYWNPKLKLKDD